MVCPVPPGVTMVGIPARLVETHSPQAVIDLEHGRLPDPLLRVLDAMAHKHKKVEERLQALEKELKAEGELAGKLS